MTEQDAKTKWCPMARTPSSAIEKQNTGINREFSGFNCIASDCMMWRWTGKYGYKISLGYCGLGGK